MTAKGTQTIKYDPEQRPVRIQDGTSDPPGGLRRRRRPPEARWTATAPSTTSAATSASWPVAPTLSEALSPSTTAPHFGAMSRPLAFRRGGTSALGGLRPPGRHRQGAGRAASPPVDGMRYRPFGEDRDAGTGLNTDRKFTGQTEDEAAGLYWYASRAYDPAQWSVCLAGFDCAGAGESPVAEPLQLRIQQSA